MKKVLAVLAVVLMLATSAFAVTLTKELAKGGMPGVLYDEATLTSVDAFPSLLPKLANVVLLDYVDYEPIGQVVLKTDLGVIGIGSSPATVNSIDLYDSFYHSVGNILNLSYATAMDNMTVGAALLFGMWNESEKDLAADDSGMAGAVNDSASVGASFTGARAGVSMGDLDLALTFDMRGDGDVTSDDYEPSGNLDWEETETVNVMKLGLNARTKLSGWTLAGSVNYVMGSYSAAYAEDYGDDGTLEEDWLETSTNSSLLANVLAGYNIKASESLLVTIGTGVSCDLTGDYKYKYTDNLDDTNDEIDGGMSAFTDITIPLWVAVEGKLNETWTVLSGVKAEVLTFNASSYKYDDDADINKQKLKDYYSTSAMTIDPDLSGNFAVGLQGKIGDLTLVMNLEPAILLDGPNFISGTNGYSMNSDIALVYNWK